MTQPIRSLSPELSSIASNPDDSVVGQAIDQLSVFSKALKSAETYKDNDLTLEANFQRQTEMRDQATQRASAAVSDLARKATEQAEAARAGVASYELDPTKVSGSEATAMWEHNLRPELESSPWGAIDWSALTANASAEELVALQKYLPSWVRRNVPANGLSRELRDVEAKRILDQVDDAIWRRGVVLNGGADALAAAEHAVTVEQGVHYAASQVASGRVKSPAAVASMSLNLKTFVWRALMGAR